MTLPRHLLFASSILGLAACSQPAAKAPETTPLSGDWVVNSDGSHVSFVSIKSGDIAEAHTFGEIDGTVLADGSATIEIPLETVQTNIDLRDERMRDFLFETDTYPTANVTAKLDPAVFSGLGIGDSTVIPVTAQLDLHGQTNEIDTNLQVTRIAADKVLVTTVTPIFIDTADFALSDGVEKLRELANLPAITPVVPVDFSILLTH